MSAEDEFFDTEEYDSSEEFIDDVLDAFENSNSVFIHGPDYEDYGTEAYIEANKKAASENFWAQISLNPIDWLNPDIYRVTKQETDEGLRINYREV